MAFKMKGSPMQRNFGIGTPAKKVTSKEEEKDTRTDDEKTADWNAKNAERTGTTATYDPESGTYTSDKPSGTYTSAEEKEHFDTFKTNVLKNSPGMTEAEVKEAYASRQKS